MTDKLDTVVGRGGGGDEPVVYKNRRVDVFSISLFFLHCCPGEVRAKIKALAVGLETLSGNPHSLDKVSSAAQLKYAIEKEDIFGDASSHVQLCYLNKLCGIIIRLMLGQDWLLQG